MAAEALAYVRACPVCQQTTSNITSSAAAPNPIPPPSRPNQRIHIDLFGPLKDKSDRQCHILSMVDAFSKQIRLASIPNKEAPTVAEALWRHWLSVFGVPEVIVTDNGKEFANKIHAALWRILGVDHRRTSPFFPRSNMQVEHTNKSTAKFLRSALFQAQADVRDWKSFLPALAFSLNTSVNAATKATPHQVMFGYDPRVPLWSDIKKCLAPPNSVVATAHPLAEWAETLRLSRLTARAALDAYNLQLSDQRRIEAAKDVKFRTNDHVWLKVQPLAQPNPKLNIKWRKAVILRCLGPDSFLLEVENSNGRKSTLRANRAAIKPRFSLPVGDDDAAAAADETRADAHADADEDAAAAAADDQRADAHAKGEKEKEKNDAVPLAGHARPTVSSPSSHDNNDDGVNIRRKRRWTREASVDFPRSPTADFSFPPPPPPPPPPLSPTPGAKNTQASTNNYSLPPLLLRPDGGAPKISLMKIRLFPRPTTNGSKIILIFPPLFLLLTLLLKNFLCSTFYYGKILISKK
jgi:hypothetical protein